MKRRLKLSVERLAPLGVEDLRQIAGGASDACDTLPINLCVSLQVCVITHQATCLVTLARTC